MDAGVTDRMIGEQYLYSLYWSVTTLTTIGYGDIVAVNNIERLIAIIAMLCGGFIYAYVPLSILDMACMLWHVASG